VTSGDLGQAIRAGVISIATTVALHAVGGLTASGSIANIAGHAIVGCLSSMASGGKCGPGAAAAAVSAAGTPFVSAAFKDDLIGGTAASAVLGGLGSVAGGGKFENGAVTGAFGYLFNWCAHEGPCAPRSSNLSPGIPDKLALALNYVESKIIQLGDEGLIDRYDAMRVRYVDVDCGLAADGMPLRVGTTRRPPSSYMQITSRGGFWDLSGTLGSSDRS